MSIQLTVRFEGKSFDELADSLNRRVPAMAKNVLSIVLTKGLEEIETLSRQYVPVRTGRLRSTIMTERFSELEGAVMAYAEYAKFVEYGTRYMRAQPYLRPALMMSTPSIINYLKMVLPEKLREVFIE